MYDVIIAGGGPAGSTAAKFLAERGIHCLLVDKAKFPRDKSCGGALTHRAVERYPFLSPFVETVAKIGYIYGSKPDEVFRIDKENLIAHYSRRRVLDAGLLDLAKKAGAEVKEQARVCEVKEMCDKVVVSTANGEQFTGKFLIGADGVGSVVRRQIGLERYWHKKDLTLIYEAEVEVGQEVIEQYYTKDCISHIHFQFGGALGYGWVFPKKKHINIGFGAFLEHYSPVQLKELFRQYVEHCKKIGLCPPIDTPRPAGWFLHMTGPIPRFTTRRVLLAGDAAGFAHPVSGEGIIYAIWCADIAAEILDRHFKDRLSPGQAANLYQSRCLREFGNELREMGRYPRYCAKWLKVVMRIARKDEKLVYLLFRLSAGLLSFDQVKWKLIYRALRGVVSGKIF